MHSNNNELREQFEAWYMDNWGFTEDDHETLFESCPDSDEEYYRLGVRLAHHAWQAATSAMEAKCAALAAENAKLADCANFYRLGFKPVKGAFGIEYRPTEQLLDDCGNIALEAIKTPATDAFLAEVRTKVWIEGNEPAEIGRYWVRYETDVGPQYCSAQWLEHNFCASSDTNIHKIWLADHSRSINSLRGVTHYTKLPEALEGAAS